MGQEIWNGLEAFVPELLLIFTIVMLILLDVMPGKRENYLISSLTVCGLFLAFLFTLGQLPAGGRPGHTGLFFNHLLAVDPFAIYFKLLFIVAALLLVLLSQTQREIRTQGEGEYCTLALTCVLGMFLFVSSANLLMLYLSIEMISIPSYILSGFFRGNRRSVEASLKYVVYGAGASGMMIYGFSLLYGMTGTLDLGGIREALGAGKNFDPTALSTVALLILAGFGYKVAAVPFHMWCPDIYEGAPTPITAFLSVGPKAAGFGALIRFFYGAFGHTGGGEIWQTAGPATWPMLIAIIAVATMTIGNLAALLQTNLKRLMAYSSIAHAGYLLMGLVVLSRDGLTAILFYLAIYLIMNFGAFIVVALVAEKTGSEELPAYRGLGWKSPMLGIAMAFFLFSLMGVPPTAGFVGKLYIFSSLIRQGWYWLALAGVLNSVVSVFYYAKIIKAMFLEGMPAEGQTAEAVSFGRGYHVLLGLMAAPLLLLGLYWVPLYDFAHSSVRLMVLEK